MAFAIGVGIGALMLTLFARLPAKPLADQGFLALVAMVSIYLGAELVTGSLTSILIETAIATVAIIAAKLAMVRWLPAIGIAIVLHGCYDAFVGPHTGVAEWYPPLCAGFDFFVGAALVWLLMRKSQQA